MATLTATRTDAPASTRVHGLDALRAGALLLGIVLHSLLPFAPEMPWLVSDSRSTGVVVVPVYVIHLFRMVLFMCLAGYFGRMVVQRRGPSSYLRDRLVRILLPLVAFWPVSVLSLGLLVVVNARVHDLPFTPPPTDGDPLSAVTPGQLWFLLVLMECVLLTLLARVVARRVLPAAAVAGAVERLGGLLAAPGGVLVAAVPYLACLLMQGTVVGGVLAPQTLAPSASALTAYLGAFVTGWALHARRDALARLARSWPAHLLAALVLTVVGLTQSAPDGDTPLPVAAAVMAVSAWCWVYALTGLCVRFLTVEHAWIRYLADASYWMYLVHLPLLVAFEIPLVRLDWPIPAKLAVTWLVVGAVMVTSYHLLVRSTPLGRWLNGRRHPFRWPFTSVEAARRR